MTFPVKAGMETVASGRPQKLVADCLLLGGGDVKLPRTRASRATLEPSSLHLPGALWSQRVGAFSTTQESCVWCYPCGSFRHGTRESDSGFTLNVTQMYEIVSIALGSDEFSPVV